MKQTLLSLGLLAVCSKLFSLTNPGNIGVFINEKMMGSEKVVLIK